MPRKRNKDYIIMGGIKPKQSWSAGYEKVIRERVTRPYQNQIARVFGEALLYEQGELVPSTVIDRLVHAMEAVRIDADEVNYAVTDTLKTLWSNHTEEVIKTYSQAIGVNISHLLKDPTVNALLNEKIAENVALIRTLGPRHKKGLLDKLQKDLINNPFDRQSVTKYLQQQNRVSGYNLRRIARDQTSKLTGQLTQKRHMAMGLEYFMWSTSMDSRVRDTHQVLEGRVFTWAEGHPSEGIPGQAIQCFPKDTLIHPAGLKRSVSYRYVGELIKITLADGSGILSTTPNHPILTQRGWVPAGLLNELDQVIIHCNAGRGSVSDLDPKATNMEWFAEELHDFLSTGNRQSRPTRTVDLYGNPSIGDEDVNVVLPPSELRNCFKAMGGEIFHDFPFKDSNSMGQRLVGFSTLNSLLHRPTSVSGFDISRLSQLLTFLESSVLHPQKVGFASSSRCQAEINDAIMDHVPANSQSSAHAKNGFARFIRGLDRGVMDFSLFAESGLIDNQSVNQSQVQQTIFDSVFSNTQRLSDMIDGFTSFEKFFDIGVKRPSSFKVIGLRSISSGWYDGEIYSFETDSGMILANGIVVSNCRCTGLALLDKQKAKKIKEDAEKSDPKKYASKKKKSVKKNVGVPDSSLAPPTIPEPPPTWTLPASVHRHWAINRRQELVDQSEIKQNALKEKVDELRGKRDTLKTEYGHLRHQQKTYQDVIFDKSGIYDKSEIQQARDLLDDVHSQMDLVNDKISKVRDQLTQVFVEIQTARNGVEEALFNELRRRLLKPDAVQTPKIKIEFEGRFSKVRESKFEKHVTSTLNEYAHLIADWNGPLDDVKVIVHNKKIRAYADKHKREVHVSAKDLEDPDFGSLNRFNSIFVHEMEHIREFDMIVEQGHSHGLRLLESRTRNEHRRRLKDVVQNSGYKKDEWTREDAFVDPYMGKDDSRDIQYRGYVEVQYAGQLGKRYVGSTELQTMGVQHFWKPVTDDLIKKDQQYFDWIIESLFRRNKP